MSEITLIEAINQALHYEMKKDDSIILFGEDIGKNGGVFRATLGLYDEFGPERVVDTPLSETLLAGMAVGVAAQGLKPIVEFQFLGFMYSGLDQIINHAARLRNRTRGRLNCPIVYRAPHGGGIHAPEHHSESTEALFTQIPGLRVVMPSTPLQAYGLLLASIRNPDPIIFLEPERIYRSIKQEVPNTGNALPLDECFVIKEGKDVTLISWGAVIHEVLTAAEKLAEENIHAEVIDVATLKPLDEKTILSSIEKTSRCVIIHEAPRTCGVGAEIAARIAEKSLFSLSAPIERVTGYDTIIPYAKMEKFFMPDVNRILEAVKKTLQY